jgi:hypothetical protein
MARQDDYLKTYKMRHTDWSGGMRDEVRGTLLNDNQSQILYDATFDQRGTLYPCNGHKARYGTPLTSKIDGIGYYEKANGKQYIIIASGTKLYYDDLSATTPTLVEIPGTFTASDTWDFTVFNDNLYITNGKDKLKKWDGTTLTELTSISYIFSHIETHNNRLWGVEANSSRLRWSAVLNGDSWDALDFMDFNPSDGDYIRKAIRYQSYLAVLKRKTKAILTGDKTSNYAYTWLDGYGAVGTYAVDVAEKYLAYVSMDGIRVTDLVNDTIISLPLNTSWQKRVNKDALYKAALTHWRNYILVALPVNGSSYNNEVWCFDLRYNSWVILRNLNIGCWVRAFVNGDEVLFGADAVTGQIYQIFKYGELHYPDGYALVEYEWLSKEWTFGEPERYKLFKNIYLELEGVEELSRINMWIYIDDIEYEVSTEAIDVPDGVGLYRHVRLIPPIYGAVLGRKLSIKLQGRVGVRSVTVEFSFRSNVPPGGVI